MELLVAGEIMKISSLGGSINWWFFKLVIILSIGGSMCQLGGVSV